MLPLRSELISSMPLHKSGHINIEFAEQLSAEDLAYLAHHINAIYLEEEGSIWPHDGTYERTNTQELAAMIEAGELIIARNKEGVIMGSIRMYKHEGKWFYGILITVPKFRKQGVGAALVRFVEEAVATKGDREIWIELLFSETSEMSNKVGMRGWYTSKGYEFVRTIPFAEKDAEKAKLMRQPCYFEIMRKPVG